MLFRPAARPAGIVIDAVRVVLAPAASAGTLTWTSSGSLVVTLELLVEIRGFAVAAGAAPAPMFFMVKETVAELPATPLAGVTVRFWTIRSDSTGVGVVIV